MRREIQTIHTELKALHLRLEHYTQERAENDEDFETTSEADSLTDAIEHIDNALTSLQES